MAKKMNKARLTLTLILGMLTFLTSCEVTRKAITKTSNPGFEGFDPNYILPYSSDNIVAEAPLPKLPLPITSNLTQLQSLPLQENPEKPRELFNEIPPTNIEKEEKYRVHIVKKNESFWVIAKRYKINYKDLMVLNDADSKTILRVGMEITLPDKSNQTSEDSKHRKKYLPLPKDGKYIVKKNDNLWVIARKFGLRIDDIKYWNNLSNNTIHPEMVLIFKVKDLKSTVDKPQKAISKSIKKPKSVINPKLTIPTTTPKLTKPISIDSHDFYDHDLEKSDTISELANIYGSTPQLIKTFNKIKNDIELHKKSAIRIPVPKQ